MANINWITTRKHLTAKRVDADLRRLIANKSGDAGSVTVPDCPKHPDDHLGFWMIDIPFKGLSAGTSVTLVNRNRITFKPNSYEVSNWLETWLRNELGVLYNGMCGGEHDDKRWAPDNTKYITYRLYVERMHSHWTSKDRSMLLDGLGKMVDR